MERRADCPSAAVVICFPLSSFSLPLTRAQEELFLLFGYFSNAAVNLRVLVVMQIYVFISLGHIHRYGITGSYVHSMFRFFRNYQTFSKQLRTTFECLYLDLG